jgi:hypothetical protein
MLFCWADFHAASSTVLMPKRYLYHIYGLNVASAIELPELPEILVSDVELEVAATVSLATLTEKLAEATTDGAYLQVAGDRCQFNVDGIACYRIEQGQRILIDPAPGSAPGDVRLFLLGSAFGALLHQRGNLPLHVSSVATPGGVWAFTGDSGAGKSTLAATLHFHLGWPLLSDDVAVLDHAVHDRPLLHPGPPRLKLWQDAVTYLEIDSSGLTPDMSRVNKFHLPLAQGFEHDPQCLRALVVLERASDDEPPSLTQLSGMAAFQAVLGTVYRPEMAQLVGDRNKLFHQCATLVQHIAVYRYRRPWSLATLDSNLQPLARQVSLPKS